jgi:orotate phosphoribosyltransferase
VLHTSHNTAVGFAYDRKEVKDHGEGGNMIGAPVTGKRVVILDDVMTSGTAVRNSIDLVKKAGGEVVGVVQLLDREEVGKDNVSSTVHEIEGLVGVGRVKSILKMRDFMMWLDNKGMKDESEEMQEYWQTYGIKQ